MKVVRLSFPNPPAEVVAPRAPVARVSEPRLEFVAATPRPGRLRRPVGRFESAVQLWHLASLDAPSVALVWSMGFAWAARVRLAAWVLALQVLVVWVVYVGDRLLDARSGLRRGEDDGLRERHFFHWRHRKVLAPLAAAAGCAAAGIALRWMPAGTRDRDAVLGVASMAYFTRVHAGGVRTGLSRLFTKELLVGVLFAVGCALPAWSRGSLGMLAAPVAMFAAVAWLNCWAIEKWEAEKREPARRCARAVARAATLIALAGLAALTLQGANPRMAALLAAASASAALLGLLDRARERMTVVTLRAAADLVLLAPALLLLAEALRR